MKQQSPKVRPMIASIKTILSSIVDYAGLFPPAKLPMQAAMANYDRDCVSPYDWMQGRFVLPASRLNEFEKLIASFSLDRWSLSVVLSGNLESELETVQSISDGGKIVISALEFPPLPFDEIESVFPNLCAGVDAFFEIPFDSDLTSYLTVLKNVKAMAKIRTGGITADAFPSATQLSQYITAFAQFQIPFKATAGLHHPLRGDHRLTYEPDSDLATMHGFLNVAILAAMAYWQKTTPEEALELLDETASDRFQISENSIIWRDRSLTIAEIESSRQHFFRSFGSCSFQEPIDDLKALNLLS